MVQGLSDDDMARLRYFEEAEYDLSSIRIETAEGPSDALYFGATGKALPTNLPWDFAEWQRTERDVAIEAATELMAHLGVVPVEQIDDIWRGIMIRARMRVRARSETPVAGHLRSVRQAEDVVSEAVARPYTRYFAVEEHLLRHRKFDGTLSGTINRAVLTSGDAVTVIPYDPVRDRVLLIEQFRAPMFVRGDACPWGIEAIAGRLDQELDAESCARREAREEGGVDLGRMELVGRYYTTPGVASEHLTSFVGEADLAGTGGVFGVASEHEDIRAFTVELDVALAGVASGEVNNAPAMLTLLWLQLNRHRLQELWR